jgi:hypothetical protein
MGMGEEESPRGWRRRSCFDVVKRGPLPHLFYVLLLLAFRLAVEGEGMGAIKSILLTAPSEDRLTATISQMGVGRRKEEGGRRRPSIPFWFMYWYIITI